MEALIRAGDLEIDPAKRQARVEGRAVELEPKAFAVLIYLVERRERVVSKEEIFAAVWPDVAVTDNALTRVIAQLRRQLGDDAKAPRYIETVPTVGYRFIAAVEGGSSGGTAAAGLAGGTAAGGLAGRTADGSVAGGTAGRTAAGGTTGGTAAVEGGLTGGTAAGVRGLSWQVLAAVALSLVVGGLALWRMRMPVEWLPAPRIEQVTNTSALDLNPSFSPDGRQIVFSSNRSGRFQLYVRSISGGSDRQLAELEEDAIQPAWSPDGRWIAFVLGAAAKVSVMPAEGGAIRTLSEGGVFPAWSPDSTRLVYRVGVAVTAREAASFEATRLMTIAASGGPPRELTKIGSPPGGHNTPVWLRDGRRILFCASLGDMVSQPWTADVESGEVKRFSTVSASVLHARVSPDGGWLYFSSVSGLMRMRLPDGKPETLVAAGAQMPRDLAFSADGKRLVFSQVTDQATLWRAPLDGGAEAGPFFDEVGVRASYPSFSKDGRYLAYCLLRRGARFSIQIMDAQGGASRPFSAPDVAGVMPSWTEGGELGYMLLKGGGPEYWMQPLNGAGRTVAVKLDRRFLRRVKLSPDARWLAGHLAEPGRKPAVFVANTSTGEARIVTPRDRDIAYPTWSADSQWIAAEERLEGSPASMLVALLREGGPIETLVSQKMHNWPNDVAADNDTIAFSGMRDGIWNIYTVSRRTRQVKQVTHFKSRALLVRYPALSRTSREVVFEYGELKGSVYSAELK